MNPKLVLAFDNDEAGKKACNEFKKYLGDQVITSVMLSHGEDWNSYLCSHDPHEAAELLKEDSENWKKLEFNAALTCAESAKKYAEIYHSHHSYIPSVFEFEGQTYSASSKKTKDGEEIRVKLDGNFIVRAHHFQIETVNQDEPTNRFYLEVFPKGGVSTRFIASAQDLSSAYGLRVMFSQRSRCSWSGNDEASNALARKILSERAPIVRQTQTIGLDEQSGLHVFRDFAIHRTGELIRPSKGSFKLSIRNQVRPPSYATLNPIGSASGISPADIYNLISRAWPGNGPVAVAWLLGAWFVRLIKLAIGFFPFLSFWGDPQTGKSNLARTFNAMQCLDEEGIPIHQVNTAKGEIRRIGQRSCLASFLLETGNLNQGQFRNSNSQIMDLLLTVYNNNGLYLRALKSNDLQVNETPFHGALAFVQNIEPFRTKQHRERVISLKFTLDEITTSTTEAFQKLVKIPVRELATFFPAIMSHRPQIEANWYSFFEQAKQDLNIPDPRIGENHALILAFHRVLLSILQKPEDPAFTTFVKYLAARKIRSVSDRQETVGDLFLDLVLSFDPKSHPDSMDIEQGELWLHIPTLLKEFREEKLVLNSNAKDLYQALQEHPGFKCSNRAHRFGTEVKKAWVFDMDKLGPGSLE